MTKKNAVILTALLCVLCTLTGCGTSGTPAEEISGQEKKTAVTSDNPLFSLNGSGFPYDPVLSDFYDRGWKQSSVASQIGDYSPEDENTEAEMPEMYDSGYYMNDGNSHICVLLDKNSVLDGTDTTKTPVSYLEFNGYDVDSFIIGGYELSGTTPDLLVSCLGEPESQEGNDEGITYYYTLSENPDVQISFCFPDKLDTVGEITVSFSSSEDPVFSINGDDYPQNPVLSDFTERGWKIDRSSTSISGYYSEADGAYNMITDGYRLRKGKNSVFVHLDADQLRSGKDPLDCLIFTLDLSTENVESFMIDGHELSSATRDLLTEYLGEPDDADPSWNSMYYYLPDRGIPYMSFSFSYTTATVDQIKLNFDFSFDYANAVTVY